MVTDELTVGVRLFQPIREIKGWREGECGIKTAYRRTTSNKIGLRITLGTPHKCNQNIPVSFSSVQFIETNPGLYIVTSIISVGKVSIPNIGDKIFRLQ